MMGAVVSSAAILGAAFCNRLSTMILCWTIYSLGVAAIYQPMLQCAQSYFQSDKGTLAMGFQMAGMGAGGLVYAFVVKKLLYAVGYEKTLLILAAMNLTILLPVTSLTPELKEKVAHRWLPSRQAWRSPVLHYTLAAALFNNMGFFTPISFGPEFSRSLARNSNSKGLEEGVLALILSISGLARPILGLAAKKFGTNRMLGISMLASAATVFALWLPSALTTRQTHAVALWWIFNVCYGLVSGGYLTLFQQSVKDLCSDDGPFKEDDFSAVMLLVNVVRGIGVFIGTPVSGYLAGGLKASASEPSDFKYTIVWSGMTLVIATAFFAIIAWKPRQDSQCGDVDKTVRAEFDGHSGSEKAVEYNPGCK